MQVRSSRHAGATRRPGSPTPSSKAMLFGAPAAMPAEIAQSPQGLICGPPVCMRIRVVFGSVQKHVQSGDGKLV